LKEIVLGRTGLKVKSLGFGGIPIQRVSEEEAVEVVRRCYDLGLNYYDTARGYTTSEERIGKALEDVRDRVIIATKSHQRTAEGIERELEISLRNLRADHIDVYQLHNVQTRLCLQRIQRVHPDFDEVLKDTVYVAAAVVALCGIRMLIIRPELIPARRL